MLKGDFAGLVELQKRMRALGNEKTRLSFARLMGAEAVTLVQLGFRNGVDPYGVTWAPLKHRNGKPLLDTGRLRSSFSAQPTAKGFELGTNVTYAKFHQYGTGGRKKASSRTQATGRNGRFMSKAKAGRQRGGSVGFRFLNFAAGGGAIPARVMVPTAGNLGPIWSKAFEETATRFFSRLMKKK